MPSGVKSLLPPPLRLSQLLGETTSREPILIVTSPGTDPSQELRTLSQTVHLIYHEVSICILTTVDDPCLMLLRSIFSCLLHFLPTHFSTLTVDNL